MPFEQGFAGAEFGEDVFCHGVVMARVQSLLWCQASPAPGACRCRDRARTGSRFPGKICPRALEAGANRAYRPSEPARGQGAYALRRTCRSDHGGRPVACISAPRQRSGTACRSSKSSHPSPGVSRSRACPLALAFAAVLDARGRRRRRNRRPLQSVRSERAGPGDHAARPRSRHVPGRSRRRMSPIPMRSPRISGAYTPMAPTEGKGMPVEGAIDLAGPVFRRSANSRAASISVSSG